MSDSTPSNWRDEARQLNCYLHALIGQKPCETACTHFATAHWSLLGIANVAARNGSPVGG